MTTKEFLFFNDMIINKSDVMHIKKVKLTRGYLNQGICLTLRNSDRFEEWFNEDQRKRDDRFNALKTILC